MADVIDPEVVAYAEAHTTPVAAFMTRLAQETHATLSAPQMLTGVVEGRFLEMLVFATGARRVLELGHLLRLLGAVDGRGAAARTGASSAASSPTSTPTSPSATSTRARYADRIEIRRGPAIDTIATLEGPFDLVFVDADKTSYAAYVEACLPLLSERGLMAIDNTLWSREVFSAASPTRATTRARCVELNDALAADPRVVCVQLPIRDGVTLVRRA